MYGTVYLKFRSIGSLKWSKTSRSAHQGHLCIPCVLCNLYKRGVHELWTLNVSFTHGHRTFVLPHPFSTLKKFSCGGVNSIQLHVVSIAEPLNGLFMVLCPVVSGFVSVIQFHFYSPFSFIAIQVILYAVPNSK